jgi:UDP-glucose 4-epimerase
VRVVVTGATGCVGRAVCAALAASGSTVVAAARHAGAAAPNVEPRAIDLVHGDVGALVAGADAIVHLAARAHTAPRGAVELEQMRAANVDATGRLVDAARRAGVGRFVYTSTVAVYGAAVTSRGPVPDDAETEPSTPYGRGKLEGEAIARAAGAVALRLALVFGPCDRGNVATLLAAARARRAFVVGGGVNKKSVVYSGNVADRVALLLALDDARWSRLAGDAYNVVDASPTQRDLVSAVARAVGCQSPPAMPLAPFVLAGAAIDLVMRVAGRTPRWRARVEKLAESTEFVGDRLDRELGYAARVSLADGLAAEVAAMGARA